MTSFASGCRRCPRGGPRKFRAWPDLHHFQPENRAETQILKNVWVTGGRKRRCRQANRGGGKLRFWEVAPHRGRVSNSGDGPVGIHEGVVHPVGPVVRGWRPSLTQTKPKNSSIVRRASRRIARKRGSLMVLPRCIGTTVRALVSGCTRMRWLPRRRSSTNPTRLSTRTTLRAVRDGSLAIYQAGTVTGTVTLP